ncbi:MAG: toprim domain-containing protein [Campylobacterota bacterium]|nr:toprim domain-containing protein [Campylobacterota bacterium]
MKTKNNLIENISKSIEPDDFIDLIGATGTSSGHLLISPLSDSTKDTRKQNFYLNYDDNKEKWFFNCLKTQKKGDMVDLYMLINNCNIETVISLYKDKALAFGGSVNLTAKTKKEKEVIEIPKHSISKITNKFLLKYLESRKIKKIPNNLNQIYINEYNNTNICMKNHSGGYVMSNVNYKGNLKGGKQDLTFVRNSNAKKVIIVEGMFDYASLEQHFEITPRTVSYIILNSTTNLKKLIDERTIGVIYNLLFINHTEYIIALDNDRSGIESSNILKGFFDKNKISSRIVKPKYNDWNDDLMNNVDIKEKFKKPNIVKLNF